MHPLQQSQSQPRLSMNEQKKTAVLVGIAGSNNAFSLSLYNIKAYCIQNEIIKQMWNLPVIQHPLIIHDFTHHAIMQTKVNALANHIMQYQPQVVAFSCYMWNIKVVEKLSIILRQQSPNALLVWGGPEMATDYVVQGKYNQHEIDYCITGEGELTFLELLQHLTSQSPSLENIPGLSYRKNDRFHVNPKRLPFKSLMQIPSPYFNNVVDLDVLHRPNVEANIETQRGCSLRCAYCIYHKDMGKITYSHVQRVVDEVRYVCSHGVKRIRFVDANFSSDLTHAKQIVRALIQYNIEARIMFELIPGFIDEELTSLFHQYNNLHEWNLITLGIGVQTINHEVLKKMRRGIRIEKFEKTFNLLEKYGIYAKIDLIIGLPGEDIHSIESTLEYFLDRLRHSHEHLLCCHVMRGLPGTELLDIAKDYHMVFSSEREPHELIESPVLPRQDMLRCLRRTAIIFRLVNHQGWARREFIWEQKYYNTSIRDCFFAARDALGVTNIELIDTLVEKLLPYLAEKNSHFSQPDFPYAESWWWTCSKTEISNAWLIETLKAIMRSSA